VTRPRGTGFEGYGLQPVHQATEISRALAPEGRTPRNVPGRQRLTPNS